MSGLFRVCVITREEWKVKNYSFSTLLIILQQKGRMAGFLRMSLVSLKELKAYNYYLLTQQKNR